ncbi:MAG: heterodisulfide reductase-related iron-sulfur binding cluster [Thermoplasmata archaeon]
MITYFPGCMATYRAKDIAKGTIELLKKGGVEFKLLGADEWCCGSVLLRTGNVELARKIAEHNIQAFKKAGTTQVLTSCAGCYRTLKKDYEEMFGKQDFEVIHIVDFLEGLIDEGKLKFPRVEMKVTYHDPCHLGRHSDIYEAPRRILSSIQGLELLEMARNRKDARCCGAGGGVRAAFAELADQMADERLGEAEETGAEVLTSACPFCTFALRDAAKRKGSKIRVLDLPELLVEILE